ncbi:hypothetical protein AGI3411_03683 [Achromobacter agilis]|uniref:Uncharacterized protein n=1 Tax=Achromobacter agilis TaxID=1353888 RepID=A0A446CL56_9BURK|nr:hypothetical protein AGI3411_03683 [Achromobacter agilis]
MQAAILKSGRTAPYSKSVHTAKTHSAALAATGRMRLSVVSAVHGVAKSTIQIWIAQDRSPEPVANYPRVQSMTRGRCAALADRPWRAAYQKDDGR